MYSEGYKEDGKLSKLFKSRADGIVEDILINYFTKPNVKKILKSSDYRNLAKEFCLLIREPEFTNTIIAYKINDLTNEQKDKKVKRVVDFFLNGYKKS